MQENSKQFPISDKRYHIARILRENRIKCNLSHEDVQAYLERNNIQKVSIATIYAWENGNSAPSNNVFLELCKLYHISEILYAFGYDDLPSERQLIHSLSTLEQRVILAYRNNQPMQFAIRKLLGI